MLKVEIDEVADIAILEPDGKLTKNDFTSTAEIIDHYITNDGKLRGIIINVKSFPYWDSFSALIAHLSFIKEHQKKISYIAIVTDSPIGDFAEHIGRHFISAEMKHFKFGELEAARKWMLD